VLLAFQNVVDAEYLGHWRANKAKCLSEAAKAHVKGEKPAINDDGQHAKTKIEMEGRRLMLMGRKKLLQSAGRTTRNSISR